MSPPLTPAEVSALAHWCTYGVRSSATTPPHSNFGVGRSVPSSDEAGSYHLPPTDRIVPYSKQSIKPMLAPVVSAWDQKVPVHEVGKLMMGFRASVMEEKWNVYTEDVEGDGQGEGAGHVRERNYIVNMVRSWTGFLLVSVRLEVVDAGSEGQMENPIADPGDPDGESTQRSSGRQARFTEITWESSNERYKNQTEAGAKEMVRGVCDWCLGVTLP